MVNESLDINRMAAVQAQAFFEDPLFVYFFPEAGTRYRTSLHTHRFLARQVQAYGAVEQLVLNGNLAGVALWLPSHKRHIGWVDLIRFGGMRALVAQGAVASWRQLRVGDMLEKLQHQLLPEPHWYLLLLGILEAQRGKGHSRTLLTPMLARADREGLPLYLDTHEAKNVSIYRRFGFAVASEMITPGTPLHHWAMIRRPC